MAVSIAALAIGAGIAIYGAVKQNQAKKKAKQNQRPEYNIPKEEYDYQHLAESRANQGMGAQSRQYYQEQANQGLASTNAAILRGGGDANALAGSYTGYEKGLNSLAVYDDQARIANLDKLSNAYLRMSANKDKQWQVNTYGKWADTAQALAAEQAGAQQTMNAGIGIAGQGLSGLASGMSHRAPSTQTQGAAAPDPSMNMSGPQSFGKNSGGGQLPDPSMQGMSGPQTYQSGYSPTVGNYGGGWSWSGYAPAQS